MATYPVVVFGYTTTIQGELNNVIVELPCYMKFSQYIKFHEFLDLKNAKL